MVERTKANVRVESLGQGIDRTKRLIDDVREGLTRSPKVLPPKYFYDGRGSDLFEEITRLPEYYPTRTETGLLERYADAVMELVRPHELIEIGSGASRKTRLLLDALQRVGGTHYAPLDVSVDALRDAAERLTVDYPWLTIHGVVADFEHGFPDWEREAGERRLVSFLGSTLGNLEGAERTNLLRSVRSLLGPRDGFLLGVDLIKDRDLLEAAYNDAAGVTAAFNKNVLRVLNHELDGDFDEDDFEHVAFFSTEHARIEMHLEAKRDLRARLATIDLDVTFERGERMRTEVSCKFDRARVTADLQAAGMRIESWWSDPNEHFALVLALPSDSQA